MNKLFLLSLLLVSLFQCNCQENKTNLSSATDLDSLFHQHLKNQNIKQVGHKGESKVKKNLLILDLKILQSSLFYTDIKNSGGK